MYNTLDYDQGYKVIRLFIYAAIIWTVIGLLGGMMLSLQYIIPQLNFEPLFTYGRLRPFHTNVLAYGLGINAEMALFAYMTMKLCKRPMFSNKMMLVQFIIFQIAVFIGSIGLLFGFTQANEYAEFEWVADIIVVLAWVLFTFNILMTTINRSEKDKPLYISMWYIIATLLTVAMLYIVNNLVIPAGFGSYSVFSGANSANVQWWYGHNAVGFLFTTPILAFLYYFLPKALNIPLYSHRLSIISFWSLIFLYLWTGTHHLMYAPVPAWLLMLGTIFTLLLILPSWGTSLNVFLTFMDGWKKVKDHYLTKFFIMGTLFYTLQTVQGPMQGLKSLSAVIHFTDYVPGHVHMGTMGWVTMITTACMYYLIPRTLGLKSVFSEKLVSVHFWLVLVGQLLYSVPLWLSGVLIGKMLMELDSNGNIVYSFTEAYQATIPFNIVTIIGGALFILGMVVFVVNILLTTLGARKLRTANA